MFDDASAKPANLECRSRTEKRSSSGCRAIPLLALAFFSAGDCYPQTPTNGEEPRVVIWRTLRNDFHDNTLAPSFVAEVVDTAPPALLKVGQGQTLSGKLKDTFNISEKWTPEIYQRMLSRVADLNGIENINKLPAGAELLVPQIPSAGKKYTSQPPGWTGQKVTTALEWKENSVAGTQVSNAAPATAAPQQEIQYFSVPKSELSKYLLSDNGAQGASGPITVDLTQGPAISNFGRILTEPASALVKSKLSSASGPKPVLVIMDDSIPDSTEYAIAKAFVIALSRAVRDAYYLGDSPYLDEVKAQPDSLAAESPSSLYPNLKSHASLIKQSLVEFTALDGMKTVSVVYLPLGATQIGVAPLLKEIVYLGQLLKIVRPKLPVTITASQVQRDQAKSVTDAIVASNPAAFSSGLLMPLDGAELSVTTDSLLLESLGIAMSYYADVAKRPYMLSFSWTAPKFAFPTYFEAATYGMKFAAAGNRKAPPAGADFLQLELEYASRAATSDDFVVVMNSTGTSGCPSNIFNDDGLSVATVAFPGHVTDKFCGTSFSTPRVAWLVAAKEAASGQALTVPLNQHGKLLWLSRKNAAIHALKQSTQTDLFGRYILDVEKFFSQ